MRSQARYAGPGFQKMLPELPDLRYDAAPLFAMMHPDDAERVRASMAESARTMTPWRDNYRMLTPARGAIWFEGYSLPDREAAVGWGSIPKVNGARVLGRLF